VIEEQKCSKDTKATGVEHRMPMRCHLLAVKYLLECLHWWIVKHNSKRIETEKHT